MNLSIHTHDLPADPALRDFIEEKLVSAFDRYMDHVSQFRVIVENVNGPRGGRDKRGQVIVELNHRAAPIVATSRHFTVPGSVGVAIRRASRALAKHVDQLHSHREQRQPVNLET